MTKRAVSCRKTSKYAEPVINIKNRVECVNEYERVPNITGLNLVVMKQIRFGVIHPPR